MHTYSGTANFPTAITLIDDSDAPTAVNFNVGHEGNRDAVVYLATSTAYRGKYRFLDTLEGTFALGTVNYTATSYSSATVTEVYSIAAGSFLSTDYFDATIVFSAGVTANANAGAAHAAAGHFVASTQSGGANWIWDAASEVLSELFTAVNAIIVGYTPTTLRIRVTPGSALFDLKFGLAARVNTVFAANTASADIVANGKIYINWYRSN